MPSADQVALAAAKQTLRSALQLRRAAHPVQQRDADDRLRFDRLVGLLGETSGPVAAYLHRPGEPGTTRPVAWLHAHDREVLLPVIGAAVEPDWARYTGPDDLVLGRHDILQPTGPALGAPALGRAEVVLVPALAVTAAGDRLGTGGGWYDRALATAERAVVVAVVNDWEVLDSLPTEAWDRRVEVVVTPERTIDCSRNR